MNALDWVNSVRERLGAPTLAELAAADPSETSPGRRSQLAQSLGSDACVYRTLDGSRVFCITADKDLAHALQFVGGSSYAGGAEFRPGDENGIKYDKKSKSRFFDINIRTAHLVTHIGGATEWVPIEGLSEAAQAVQQVAA